MKIYQQAKFATAENQMCPKLPGAGDACARPLSTCQDCAHSSHTNCHQTQTQSEFDGIEKKA